MDGVSTAASVIAVIQISSQIFDFCRTYYLNVKDARNDIQRLRNEITSLQDVLVSVVDLANARNSTSMHTLDLVNKEDGPLKQCQLELTALAARLSPDDTSKLKLALRTMKWPLSSKEVDRTLVAIGRYKSSFILALTTDQAALTLDISRGLAEIKDELKAQKIDVDREAIIHWLSTSDPSVNFHTSCKKCQPKTGTWLLNRRDFKEWRVSQNSLLWIHGIQALGHVFIVLDALDECPQNGDREQLLGVISDMKSRSLDNLHVLVTSRREPDIEEAMLSLLTVPAIPLQGPQVDLDIKLHISSQLSADPKLKKWPKEVKAKIENTLTDKANGMQASLIYETLEHLPRTLDETYARLFLAIDPAYQQDAKNALLWLAFSTRPLELTELAEAMVINPEAPPPFGPEERFIDPQSVFQILSSLITVSSNEDQRDMLDARGLVRPAITVTLAHFSVMEYLISDRIQQGPAKHFAISKSIENHFIAECCLLYLLQYANSTLRTNSRQDLSSFPLLEYASVFWYQHVNLAPPEHQKSLNSLVLKLLLSKSNLSAWLHIHTLIAREVEPFQYFEAGRSVTNPLFYASDMGLVSTVEGLLSDGFEANENSGSYETPLHRAVIRGHEDVVILLLKHRADVNAKDIVGRTPLHYAMESTTPVVQLLLEHGAEVNTADNGGWTPLHLAAFYSHSEVVRMLVDNGGHVEVMIVDTKQTPLHWAAWNEDGPMLDFLLQHGANINAQNMNGESALHYAARYHQSILPQLLIRGADVNMETEDGQTPLYWAASNMETEAVQILIEAGSRIDLPLLISGESGLHSVFHLLLSAGVENPKSATMTKKALQESARRGYGLCKGCQSLLSDWSGHSSSALGGFETEKEVESPGHSRRYGVEMVASQVPVPDLKWPGTRHFQIRMFPNADEQDDGQCESVFNTGARSRALAELGGKENFRLRVEGKPVLQAAVLWSEDK
ncbi:uncharacterized protein PAC_04642 [Phialocephala subalpina]|uniref:Nephrocystin 3-like N-terminal domain-containing protein n=1 Tax=Phialocephala subalpina TaxID=576137 RepID=A0A1L7WPQ7_9HELO|nr:uncharacterized protein PAC_04642 [Phialocephala subalpina]